MQGMSSTLSRIAAGVPAGGQFSAVQRGEADVDLATPSVSDSAESAARDMLAAQARLEKLTIRDIAKHVQQQYPGATYVDFADGDQSEDDIWADCVRSDDGTLIAHLHDDDVMTDLGMQLSARRLRLRDDVELIGTRNNPTYRLDLFPALVANPTPARPDLDKPARIVRVQDRAIAIAREIDEAANKMTALIAPPQDYDGDPDDYEPTTKQWERYSEAKEALADMQTSRLAELVGLIGGLS